MDKYRGNKIELSKGEWVYSDDRTEVSKHHKTKPCGYCGLNYTKEGHDGCLETLPGLMNACCGHGVEAEAYVQQLDGSITSGVEAVVIINKLKTNQ
jgi:hypothetical protein